MTGDSLKVHLLGAIVVEKCLQLLVLIDLPPDSSGRWPVVRVC